MTEIRNANNLNLSDLVSQLGRGTFDGQELRTKLGPDHLTSGLTILYTKSILSTPNRLADEDKVASRQTHQGKARADIKAALENEFGPHIVKSVKDQMPGFFSGTGKVTAGDARAVLNAAEKFERQRINDIKNPNIENLLDVDGHAALSNCFLKHLASESSAENFLFIQRSKDYKGDPNWKAFDALRSTYLPVKKSDKSLVDEVEINVDGGTKKILLKFDEKSYASLSTEERANIFDDAAAEVKGVLSKDSLTRFQKSDLADDYKYGR